MALPNRNLDDKPFAQIVDDARAIIPRVTPEWTDHNVHDPGITFVELFAWLAEIQQYRLNRVAELSVLRFLRLAGVTRAHPEPATARLAIAADAGLPQGVFVPAGSPVRPVGKEQFGFETLRDTFLTRTKLTAVRTTAAGREIDQTRANADLAAHFAPFGPAPGPGDSVRLGFDTWFAEPEIHLYVELYEQDLPPVTPLSANPRGFVPSVAIRWQYLGPDGWRDLRQIEDETLELSRSGRLRFETPRDPAVEDNARWIRATLESGRHEVAPNVAEISTNSVDVRQVERVVNEDLGAGWGTPDQIVRLSKPPLLTEAIGTERFDVGEVLDWQTMVMRLGRPDALHTPGQVEHVRRVAARLGPDAHQIVENPALNDRTNDHFREPTDEERQSLARAFDALLDDEELYDRRALAGLRVPAAFREYAARDSRAAAGRRQIRRFNRAVLQAIFCDQLISDRLEVQVGVVAVNPEDEPRTWTTWERTTDFTDSGRSDRHYVLNEETGEIRFGNGLNGRVPQATERIRARLYVHSRSTEGNLPAGQAWRFASPVGARTARGVNLSPASGGARVEPLQDAKLRARGALRARSRAVTAADYGELASRTPGLRVAQVKVLPGFNSKLPCLLMRGHVTVVVLPFAREGAAEPPQPSDGFLETVSHHLSAVRLVTTVLHVIGPAFVPVAVSGLIFLAKGASERDTQRRVERALNDFLDPVRGGPARSGWPFGRDVFPSEIHALLMRDEGVEYVAEISLNGGAPEEPLPLGATVLPFGGRHAITTVRFEQRRQGSPAQLPSAGDGACGHA